MLPNSAFYGEPETWLNATTKPNADDSAANKIPPYSTINGGIVSGKLTVNTPLENSICYAGIASDSDIASLSCIKGADFDNPLFNYEGLLNFFWGYVDTTTQLSSPARQINLNDLNDSNETDKIFLVPQTLSEYPSGNVHRYFTPYVSIVPNNFVLIIQITCVDSNYDNPATMALQAYLDSTYNINLHPPIYYSSQCCALRR